MQVFKNDFLAQAPSHQQATQQTAHYFIQAVTQYGLPHTVQFNAGTENTNIIHAQNYLSKGLPRLTRLERSIMGSSNHNEVK